MSLYPFGGVCCWPKIKQTIGDSCARCTHKHYADMWSFSVVRLQIILVLAAYRFAIFIYCTFLLLSVCHKISGFCFERTRQHRNVIGMLQCFFRMCFVLVWHGASSMQWQPWAKPVGTDDISFQSKREAWIDSPIFGGRRTKSVESITKMYITFELK